MASQTMYEEKYTVKMMPIYNFLGGGGGGLNKKIMFDTMYTLRYHNTFWQHQKIVSS